MKNNELFIYNSDDSKMITNLSELYHQKSLNDFTLKDMEKIFFLKTYPDEEKIDENGLYFINSGNKNIQNKKIPDPIFKVTIESNMSKSKSTVSTENHKGRKKKNTFYKIKKNLPHDKYWPDNILRKVQVHFINSIISCVNEILKYLNYSQRFLNIKYEIKSKINKKNFESLKKKNIGEILCSIGSPKFKKKIKYISNNKIYEEIKNDIILQNIFNENFIDFFNNIYYKKREEISFEKYGIGKDFHLSGNVKIFEDLLNGIGQDELNIEYIQKINYCIYINYLN